MRFRFVVPAEGGTHTPCPLRSSISSSRGGYGSPLSRIGAKVTVACFGMSVVWVARADGAGVPVSTAAKTRGSVAERSLAAEWRRVGASAAKRRVESGGVGQAGRVLKLVD